MAELFWLSDDEWAAIEPLLPRLGGKPRTPTLIFYRWWVSDNDRLMRLCQNVGAQALGGTLANKIAVLS